MEKISIIIPAYNEEKRISKTLEEYSTYFEKARKDKKLNYEILVVINNTKDRTLEIVKRFIIANKNIKYINLIKGGKGYAVIEGFKDAIKRNSDLIGFVDADCSTKPEAFHKLIIEMNEEDAIIASRYIRGSVVNPKPKLRRIIMSRLYNAFIRILLMMPYRDTQCGAKLFKKKALEKTLPDLTMSNWAFDVDLIYTLRKNNLRVKEVPTVWSDKEYSTINFMKSGPLMVLGIIRLRLLNSHLKSLMRIYDKLINKIRRLL